MGKERYLPESAESFEAYKQDVNDMIHDVTFGHHAEEFSALNYRKIFEDSDACPVSEAIGELADEDENFRRLMDLWRQGDGGEEEAAD